MDALTTSASTLLSIFEESTFETPLSRKATEDAGEIITEAFRII